MKERERERNITRDFNTQHTRIHIITATRPSFRMNERPFSSFFRSTDKKNKKKKVYSSFRHHKFFLCRFLDDAPHIKCVGRFSRRKRDAFPRIPPPEEEEEVLEEEEEEKEGECALRVFEEEEEEEEEQASSSSFPRWERQKKKMKKRKTFLCRRRLIFFSRRRRQRR